MVIGPRGRGDGDPWPTAVSRRISDDTLRAAQQLFTDLGYRAVTLDRKSVV